MAYGYRRYYRYSRYPYRSRRRAYSTYSRSQRRAYGNYKAAQQQKDKGDINLSIPTKAEAFSNTAAFESPDQSFSVGTFALNIWDLLRKSEFYQSYANMYDQVKINRIRLKLTPTQFPIYTGTGSIYNAYTVVTAWDRTGLSDEQCALRIADATGGTKQTIGTNANLDGLYVAMSGADVSTYSSAITKNVNPNSNTSIVRTIYPSTVAEKGFYVNTADLDEWYSAFDPVHGRYYGISNPLAVTSDYETVKSSVDNENVVVPQIPLILNESNALRKNPAYIMESPNIPFKPTLLVAITNDPITTYNETSQTTEVLWEPRMRFNVEADISVTFRGLRKAAIV